MSLSRWFTERLSLDRFSAKYLGKPFPVHTTFFLGEVALFCFVILVVTGLYLALFYEPSTESISVTGGSGLPAAYASAVLIDGHPFGALLRRMHHWAAHLMIGAIVLHMLRVFFTAAYRKPRELNWVLGLVLLGGTIAASFAGYLLPYDQFSVTATAIGYGIARSAPWVGATLADFLFAGRFPSPSTVPRFFAYHVVFAPIVMSALISLHLLILLKQKHTEPAPPVVPLPGDATAAKHISGVPFWPQQIVLMVVLFLMVLAASAALSAFLPVHPSAYYGPPGPATPEVKPDWYLLWVYGALKLIPGGLSVRLLGATIGSEAIGAMLVPGLIALAILLVPWLDRGPSSLYYAEDPRGSPGRLAAGMAVLALFAALSLAGFSAELGLSVPALWVITVVAPLGVGWGTYALAARRRRASHPHAPGRTG
jgi:cytochrome b-561